MSIGSGASAPSLAQWWEHGQVVPLDVAGETTEVFVRDSGTTGGETWTLLHGFPTSSWDFAPISPAIEARHRTVAFDFPGLGRSAKGDGVAYDIDTLVAVLLAVWDHLGVTSTRIVSHDVGTIVAQELLARVGEGRCPVEVGSMAWLNGSLYPHLYRPTDGQLALLDPDTGPALAAAVTEETYSASVASLHHPDHRPSAAVLAQHWRAFAHDAGWHEMPRFLRYMPERAARATRLVDAIETTAIAQRFVWGDADPISGPLQSAHIAERFGPEVDLTRFDDCAHYPHTERPDDVATELLRPWP